MYILWHDNDYDFAKWVCENSILKDKEVVLRVIPKTNDAEFIKKKLFTDVEYNILPIIKLANPDIIIQKVEGKNSKILFVSEFMTHTPQHDHIFQRIERIYNASKEKVPVAFILPRTKVKLEKGTRNVYKEIKYSPNPLAVHTYLKTSQINKNATLMFFWPDLGGYLIYDNKHQTAPKVKGDIFKWFNFLNESIVNEDYSKVFNSVVVKDQLNFLNNTFLIGGKKFSSEKYKNFIKNFKKYYNLDRVNIISTRDAIKKYNLNLKKLSKTFITRKKSLIFEYYSKKFRTDPYCGFVCGFTNLFCINDDNNKVANFILVPKGISFKDVSKKTKKRFPCFSEINDVLINCPIFSLKNLSKNDNAQLKKHMGECVYTKSKQQRIFGTIPDIVIFEDKVHYNEID